MPDPLARRPESGGPIAKPAPRPQSGALQGIVVIALVTLLVVFGLRYQPGMATISAGSCLFALLLLRFTSIGKLEGLGLKLENATREAHEAAEEAKATVSQLRFLAATIGKLSLSQVALRKRLGVLSPRAQLHVRDEVFEALRSAGCTEGDLARASRLLDRSVRMDLADRIAGAMNLIEREAVARGTREKGFDVSKKLYELRGKNFEPHPADAFRKLLAENNVSDGTVMAYLSDYERYEQTGELPDLGGDPNYFDDSVVE
jgi:hypothetical protein